jgi:hypothetical protein
MISFIFKIRVNMITVHSFSGVCQFEHNSLASEILTSLSEGQPCLPDGILHVLVDDNGIQLDRNAHISGGTVTHELHVPKKECSSDCAFKFREFICDSKDANEAETRWCGCARNCPATPTPEVAAPLDAHSSKASIASSDSLLTPSSATSSQTMRSTRSTQGVSKNIPKKPKKQKGSILPHCDPKRHKEKKMGEFNQTFVWRFLTSEGSEDYGSPVYCDVRVGTDGVVEKFLHIGEEGCSVADACGFEMPGVNGVRYAVLGNCPVTRRDPKSKSRNRSAKGGTVHAEYPKVRGRRLNVWLEDKAAPEYLTQLAPAHPWSWLSSRQKEDEPHEGFRTVCGWFDNTCLWQVYRARAPSKWTEEGSIPKSHTSKASKSRPSQDLPLDALDKYTHCKTCYELKVETSPILLPPSACYDLSGKVQCSRCSRLGLKNGETAETLSNYFPPYGSANGFVPQIHQYPDAIIFDPDKREWVSRSFEQLFAGIGGAQGILARALISRIIFRCHSRRCPRGKEYVYSQRVGFFKRDLQNVVDQLYAILPVALFIEKGKYHAYPRKNIPLDDKISLPKQAEVTFRVCGIDPTRFVDEDYNIYLLCALYMYLCEHNVAWKSDHPLLGINLPKTSNEHIALTSAEVTLDDSNVPLITLPPASFVKTNCLPENMPYLTPLCFPWLDPIGHSDPYRILGELGYQVSVPLVERLRHLFYFADSEAFKESRAVSESYSPVDNSK